MTLHRSYVIMVSAKPASRSPIQLKGMITMVHAVTRIVATTPSTATKIGTSTSITSEPDNVWVAARQSQINADQVAQKKAGQDQNAEAGSDAGAIEDEDQREQSEEDDDASPGAGGDPQCHLFSGESERIGSVNFDDETPFGERVAII